MTNQREGRRKADLRGAGAQGVERASQGAKTAPAGLRGSGEAFSDEEMAVILPRLDVATRDALVMAPVGTPGLAYLGLVDLDHADLEALGPTARAEAQERMNEAREWMARERLAGLAGDIAALDGAARDRLIEGLLAALGSGGQAHGG